MVANDKDEEVVFSLPILKEETLRAFVLHAWGVKIPNVQVCPDHSTPWRAFADAYFARSPVDVWWASRGFGGKSFLLSVLALTEAVTLGVGVNVLGGSGAQSKRVMEHINALWNYPSAPREMLKGDAATITRLNNGAVIEALMASQTSVRGSHPARLRLDEIDEMDISILDAAMGQPMTRKGVSTHTVMSSTRQYSAGTMQTILQRAVDRGWHTHQWCYRENLEPHGWLAHADVERKKIEVTSAMWQTEYEHQEPSPGSRAIIPEAVEKMFNRSLGFYEGAPNEYIEIEPPIPGASYAHGADWAKKSDWTIVATVRKDVTPKRVVAWERTGRMEWPAMIAKLDRRIARYGGNALHDGTGLGDVVDDYIETDGARSFIMAGRARADLLSEYIAACENGELEYPFIRYAYDEHKLASNEDVYGGEKSHLPDSISSGALMWRASTGAGEGGGFAMGYRGGR